MEKTMTLERERRGNWPLCTPTFHLCVSDDPVKLRRDDRKLCQLSDNFHQEIIKLKILAKPFHIYHYSNTSANAALQQCPFKVETSP